MNGLEYLRRTYTLYGQVIYGNFIFFDWQYNHMYEAYSFRFNLPNNTKTIPRSILFTAWDSNQNISDNWIEEKFEMTFYDDCRLYV